MNYFINKLETMKNSSKIAFLHEKRCISYKNLYFSCCCFAENLNKNRVGHHIGICMNNSIDFVIVFIGTLLSGRQAVILKKEMKAEELEKILRETECNILFSDKKEFIQNTGVYLVNDFLTYNENNTKFVMDEMCIAFFLTTSGTTDSYKIIPITYINIKSSLEIVMNYSSRNGSSIELAVLSFATRLGLEDLLIALSLGMTTIIFQYNIFKPNMFLELIKKYRITHTNIVPSMVRMLIDYIKRNPRKIDEIYPFEIWVAGEYIAKEEICFLNNHCAKIHMIFSYGLTETGTIASNGGVYIDGKEVSVGKVMNNENISIMLNKRKEILVRGASVSRYYNYSKSNEWFNTGDLGEIDTEGNLFVTGRTKNIINSGGRKISPEEIENTLLSCNHVKDVLVKGVQDRNLGEKIIAYVVLDKKNNFSEIDLRDICLEKMPEYKVPHKFYICDTIELSSSNKKNRRK